MPKLNHIQILQYFLLQIKATQNTMQKASLHDNMVLAFYFEWGSEVVFFEACNSLVIPSDLDQTSH